MKKFLAIYTGTPEAFEKSGWSKLDPAERQKRDAAGIQAWMDWGGVNASAIVDQSRSWSAYPCRVSDGCSDALARGPLLNRAKVRPWGFAGLAERDG